MYAFPGGLPVTARLAGVQVLVRGFLRRFERRSWAKFNLTTKTGYQPLKTH